MLLSSILTKLQNEADAGAALEALGDVVLFSQVETAARKHDETPGEYASGAAQRFAAAASDEDWLALMTAIERSDDPAQTTLERMVRWSLAADANTGDNARASHHAGCSCGGGGDGGSHGSA